MDLSTIAGPVGTWVLMILVFAGFLWGWKLTRRLNALEALACFDPLTGLRSGRLFMGELAKALREKVSVAVICIDMDKLKQYNAEMGRYKADEKIKTAARAILSALRRQADRDSVFRMSDAADEFSIILKGVDLLKAILLAEIIRAEMYALDVPASIGVAVRDVSCLKLSAMELYKLAEEEQIRAKQAGRNRVSPSPEAMGDVAVHTFVPNIQTHASLNKPVAAA